MKVLHTGSLDVKSGGPAMTAYLTMKGLSLYGVEPELLMYDLSAEGALIGNDVTIHFAGRPSEKRLAYSSKYKKAIASCGNFDIYHAQGVWQWPTYALASYAREVGKPYIITPHGMLYPQDIAKSSTFFKKLSLRLRLLSDLNKAACVHATCEDEMQHCRNLGVTSPIAVIPNQVEIKEYPLTKTDKVFRIGYLGRVSRRKNIHGLIQAYIDLGEEATDTELFIIGSDDDIYMNELHAMARMVKYGNVRFSGFLQGREKDEALASCSILVMPSEFENFGNVIIEGLIRRIPCIATTGAPWRELNTEKCGWQVPYTHEDILAAIRTALHTDASELAKMGVNGRRLMERRYSVEAVGQQMAQLYSWIVDGGEQPDFVFLNHK